MHPLSLPPCSTDIIQIMCMRTLRPNCQEMGASTLPDGVRKPVATPARAVDGQPLKPMLKVQGGFKRILVSNECIDRYDLLINIVP